MVPARGCDGKVKIFGRATLWFDDEVEGVAWLSANFEEFLVDKDGVDVVEES